MIGNKAQILGVSINSSSASELLNTIACAASVSGNGKCEVGSGRLERKQDVGYIGKSHFSLRYPASHFKLPASNKQLIVWTPNPEFLVEAQKDRGFLDLLNKSDINLPDGIGLIWAGRILGQPIKERVSGADMVERLIQAGNSIPTTDYRLQTTAEAIGDKKKAANWTIGIAGARRGDLRESTELVKRLGEKYKNIRFVNLDNPNDQCPMTNDQTNSNDKNSKMRGLKSAKTNESAIKSSNDTKYLILNTKYNLVFACHGMKKQEQWIWENKNKIEANVFMGVGGSLDFLTGWTKRAPSIIRSFGLEWLWRGVQKPKHFLRIWKAVFVFNWLILKEIIKNR